MKKIYLLSILFVAIVLSVFASQKVEATVGGPSFIYDFRYNPADESVYYISISDSGRGCPPGLLKISLNTGKSEVVFSCDDGEEFLQNNTNGGSVLSEINKITKDFKPLTPINLKDNKIEIDVNFISSETYSPEFDEIMTRNFNASVYQNNAKVTDLSITGCNLEQPFVFAGYAIPGFDKKIVLLLSTKGDCFEGGYIYETLHVVGGVDNLNKTSLSNFYKQAEALVPNEGTLVVFEADKVDVADPANPKDPEPQPQKPDEENSIIPVVIIVSVISAIIGALLVFLVVRIFKRNRPLS